MTRPRTTSGLQAWVCRGALALLAAGAAASPGAAGPGPVAPAGQASALILRDMRSFENMGTVLYVAAHPDDENTQLITYLALGRSYRTGYLSLTRGDGGQNLLGPEFGDLLGLIRTQELLAAREVDGGRQFFSRARDFGYSKDYRQTLTKWDHQGVLSDIVRVIRTFRPDVVITRFPPEPSATHGHHTASAALALEAFRLSGDPKAFPEQLRRLEPWQPRRILWNGYGPNWGGPPEAAQGVLHVPIDGTDPVSGASFAVLAAKSRSMHRTQGFANFSVASGGTGSRVESFTVLAGAPADKDPMDGVDTTWARIPGCAEIGTLTRDAIARFDASDPSASVPALLEIKDRLFKLGQFRDPLVKEKGRLLDKILQACLGLTVETTVSSGEIVPGERVSVHETATLGSKFPVTWSGVAYPEAGETSSRAIPMAAHGVATRDMTWVLPPDEDLTQPYWLRLDGTPGMFNVEETRLIGMPENPPAIPVDDTFRIGDQILIVRHEALFAARDPAKGVVLRRPEIVSPVSMSFPSDVQLFQPGSPRPVEVTLTSARPNNSGSIRLEVPQGWSVSPEKQPFQLLAAGDRAGFTFTVTPPAGESTASIVAWADIGTAHYSAERTTISYPHIPPLLLQPVARFKAVCVPLAIRGRDVGYLPGAGDSTAASLGQMGYRVTVLSDADLTAENLKPLDAVVIGVRAYNTRKELPAHLPGLFAYVEAGGTVIEQYNTPGGLQTTDLAPYPLKLSRDLPRYRVTDEKSAVTLLQPDHPAFNTPNRITPADFEGWVQERGLDFASEWDGAHLVPLLACSDVGEPPLQGGLLVARFGKGYFVYTGLSFFRQLPAGVPGAYRLFANLISLGR